MRKRRQPKAPPVKPLAGPPPERRSPPARARRSVEDPLLDWEDDELESDRWLLERAAGDVQRD